MKSNIGEFLAILRKSKGMTQQEAANWLGVSNKTVSSWETGASCPDISMLPALAELYGVTCDELLRGEQISAEESPEKREEKREKSLAHLLAMYRNNAAVTSWICAGLYVTAAIAALLIGCAALESLIGFFVGLIFTVGGVLLCIIQNKYLRFQLTQNDFDSAAIDKFSRHLTRRQTCMLVCGAAAFGFILPHAFIPVHFGLELGAAIGYGALGAVIAALLALLAAWLVHIAKRAYNADRKKFFWTLKNGVIPYAVIGVLCAAAIAVCSVLPLLTPRPMGSVSSFHADSYSRLRDYLVNDNSLFSHFEYTLHETDEVETTLGEEALNASLQGDLFPVDYVIGHASYFFADFPSQFEDDYHITEADGGVYVEVEVLTAALSDGSVFSSPVFNPELQGGILNFVPSWYIGEEFDDSFILILDYDIPLYEIAQARNIQITRFTLLISFIAGSAVILGGYTAFYLVRRKKFLKAHTGTT